MFNPLRTPWLTTLTRHAERTRQQREDAARERVQAVADGVRAVGSEEAVAEWIGAPVQDVHQIRQEAPTGRESDPLPERVEITLPRSGGSVWTEAEWQELDEGEPRRQAARVTAQFWRARAHAFGLLAQKLSQDGAAIGEAVLARDEWSTSAELQALVTKAGGGQWADLLFTAGDVSAHLALLEDLATGYRAQAQQAWHQEGIWRQRAEDEQE